MTPFPTAFSHWDESENAAINEVIRSGRFTMGPRVAQFEDEFAAYNQRHHAIMVNSGSSANLLAVAALRGQAPGRSDRAVVPALAWATTYAPLVQQGVGSLVLCDCDATWNAVPPSGKGSHGYNDAAPIVVACSILGNPAYLLGWKAYAKSVGAWLLNDNCESLGATLDGRPTGSYGDIATCSLFWSHQLSAIEGGVILTDDDTLARTCRLLRNHGNAGFLDPDASFEESYDFQLMGYNLRPLEMHAAIASVQLRKLPDLVRARRENWLYFAERTQGLPITLPTLTDPAGFAPFGLHFTTVSWAARRRLVLALRAGGVDCRPPTGGSFRKHFYGRNWAGQPTPNADAIHDTGLFLGCPPWPATAEIDRIVAIMKDVL